MARVVIPCAPANFLKGRPAGFRPEAIVLHRSGGTANEIRARFQDARTSLSAHYLVLKDGQVIQFVDESDTAFHAGVVVNPQWLGLKPKVNPNFYTIGIEHEGSAGEEAPEEQYQASATLIAGIADRWDIPLDALHVVTHAEIRPSRSCPGEGLDRDQLNQRALVAASANPVEAVSGEVTILKNTNLHEGRPSTSARVVEVLVAGTKVAVTGFIAHGESASGSTAWYQNEDGNFFWAGFTSAPQPRSAALPEPDLSSAILSTTAEFCGTGIGDLDPLMTDPASPPVSLEQGSREAVGAVQDLLTGHGYRGLPSILVPSYGTFNAGTRQALCDFQGLNGLAGGGVLTPSTLKQLVTAPAKDPRATQVHLSLVLGIPATGMHRVLALTALMEGVGKFAALNLNTDGAGLSFGVIQWAQRPGRLFEILSAFESAGRDAFAQIFGSGDADLVRGLLTHVKKVSGGVDPKTGKATDEQFNLIAGPWPDRFREAALHVPFQREQIQVANAAFTRSLAKLRQYDTASLIRSERAVAFMLDVANQFGDGGLAGLYRRVLRTGMSESELIHAIADASVAAMPVRFQNGVRARRTLFLKTDRLSQEQFSTSG